MMEFLRLFIAFIQIGAMSFGGGYAALPIIQDVIVNQRGWLDITEMTDIVTISQLTPGPIAVNAASFVGTKVWGIPGAIVATAGSILPQALLMIFLGKLIFSGRKVKILEKMLEALRPGVVGLIGSATLSMMISSFFPEIKDFSFDFIALVGFVVGLILYYKKVEMLKLIALGAGVGLGLGLVEYFFIL